jgi:chemotaxis protein MotA
MARRLPRPHTPRLPTPVVSLAAVSIATFVAFLAGLLDLSSLLITVGGSLAVARATFSRRRIAAAWERVVRALGEPAEEAAQAEIDALVASVKQLARVHRIDGLPGLERALDEAPELVRRAAGHALECNDAEELRIQLEGEVRREEAEAEAAGQVVVTLGKLFPAFGLIGTLIGLAQVLPRLAGEDVAGIAPALGIAVLTTLYGAVMANAVVLPVATKLESSTSRRLLRLQLVAAGIQLVHRNEYPTRVERAMRAFAGQSQAPRRDVIVLHERAA